MTPPLTPASPQSPRPCPCLCVRAALDGGDDDDDMDGEDDFGDGGGDNAFLLTIVGITGVRGNAAEVLVNGGWGIVFGCLMVSMLTAWPCVLARNIPPLVAWCWRWVSLRRSWFVPLGGTLPTPLPSSVGLTVSVSLIDVGTGWGTTLRFQSEPPCRPCSPSLPTPPPTSCPWTMLAACWLAT